MSRGGGRQWSQPELCRGCRGTVEPWQALCDPCWRRLPFDKSNAISTARRDRAPHRVADAVRAAVQWLKEHPVAAAAARMIGERDG